MKKAGAKAPAFFIPSFSRLGQFEEEEVEDEVGKRGSPFEPSFGFTDVPTSACVRPTAFNSDVHGLPVWLQATSNSQ